MAVEDDTEKRNLPWVEKYRPSDLQDLVSHKEIISTIQKLVKLDKLPHLLFYGPPGTGKTTTILACAKLLYKPAEFRSMVLELNASDDRGIDVVRNQIVSFTSSRNIMSSGFKLVILDEADSMTKDAQNALRRIIEKYTEHVRFCLICNYLNKIIPALQSRCTRFRFGPLTSSQMLPRLQHVIAQEGVNVTEDGTKSILTLANGDMRKALNILQSSAMAHEKVDENAVYTCTGHPLPKDIHYMVDVMLNMDVSESYRAIQKIKLEKGLALSDILTEVHLYVHRIDLPAHVKVQVLDRMADIEYNLSKGATERVQLGGLLAAFQMVRQLVSDAVDGQSSEETMDTQ